MCPFDRHMPFYITVKGPAKTPCCRATEKDSVAIFDLENNMRLAQLPVGYKPHEICYDRATKRCFITDFGLEDYDHKSGKTGNGFHVIDPFLGRVIKKVYTCTDTVAGNGPHGIKVRPGESGELFVN